MSKTIPADGRTKVLSERQVSDNAWTIRNEEGGADAEVYPSENETQTSIPFPAGEELVVQAEDGLFQSASTDGFHVETKGNRPTTLNILGAAVQRNQRRETERPVDRISRTGDLESIKTGTTVTAGATNSFSLFNEQDGIAHIATSVTVHCNGSGAGGTATQDVLFTVQVSDGNNNTVEERTANGPSETFKNIHIPANGNLNITAKNFSASELGFGGAITHAEAP